MKQASFQIGNNKITSTEKDNTVNKVNYNFNFIPIEYFSNSCENLDIALNYCFQKNYIENLFFI